LWKKYILGESASGRQPAERASPGARVGREQADRRGRRPGRGPAARRRGGPPAARPCAPGPPRSGRAGGGGVGPMDRRARSCQSSRPTRTCRGPRKKRQATRSASQRGRRAPTGARPRTAATAASVRGSGAASRTNPGGADRRATTARVKRRPVPSWTSSSERSLGASRAKPASIPARRRGPPAEPPAHLRRGLVGRGHPGVALAGEPGHEQPKASAVRCSGATIRFTRAGTSNAASPAVHGRRRRCMHPTTSPEAARASRASVGRPRVNQSTKARLPCTAPAPKARATNRA
jgi:hypothetical protein